LASKAFSALFADPKNVLEGDQNPSCVNLLSVTMPQTDTVIKELEKLGLRSNLRVIIGGPPVTGEYAQKTVADYAANDAVDGVNKYKVWAEYTEE
jgi:methanogenic corrinoid protein MtbC1